MSEAQPFAIHLCARLVGCDLSELCDSPAALNLLQNEVRALVDNSGFRRVADAFHFFSPNAVTGSVCLAESHVCFHSWPESKLVYLDIFACSQERDPRAAVERLLDEFVTKIFKAGDVRRKWIQRT